MASPTRTIRDTKAPLSEDSQAEPMKPSETRDTLQNKIMFAKAQGLTDIESTKEAIEQFTGPDYLLNYVCINGVKVHVYGTMESTYASEKRTVIELENRPE